MVLKRKRSDSEISSSSGLSSSPLSFNFMDMDASTIGVSRMREMTPSHLSSRTRKRYRDNRPTEEVIHQNTLTMLMNAQKHGTISLSVPQQTPAVVAVAPQPQQSSLHSFWALPSRPSSCDSNASTSPLPQTCQATNCDDCNAPLGNSSDGLDMDMDMMDIDVYANNMDHGCSSCGKQVCHQCAVSNLGAQRQCLICAGKKRWVGGLGWVDV